MQDLRATGTKKGTMIQMIIMTGLIAGTLDILVACADSYIRSGSTPDKVLRFIASGVFGQEAFSGGMAISAWGLLFHYIIALSFAALFFLLYLRIRFFSTNKILAGVVYGFVVWMVMNLIVLPLSATPKFPLKFLSVLRSATILVFTIGIPVSWMANVYFKTEKLSNQNKTAL